MGVVFRAPAEFVLINRMFRDAQVMNTDADIVGGHRVEEFIAANSSAFVFNQYGVEMIGMTGVWFGLGRQSYGQAGKGFVVLLPDLASPAPICFNAPQLVNTKGRLQFHHVVFAACLDDEIMFVAFITETLPGVFAHAV